MGANLNSPLIASVPQAGSTMMVNECDERGGVWHSSLVKRQKTARNLFDL